MQTKNDNVVYWKAASWILLLCWLTGAALYMYRIHGGFLTNYLSDLSFPPWFYIVIRGLSVTDQKIPRLSLFGDWFGRSPERAFISIFLVGLITEIKTMYWPDGPITGTYDSLDILAYFIGLAVCYSFDKRKK